MAGDPSWTALPKEQATSTPVRATDDCIVGLLQMSTSLRFLNPAHSLPLHSPSSARTVKFLNTFRLRTVPK